MAVVLTIPEVLAVQVLVAVKVLAQSFQVVHQLKQEQAQLPFMVTLAETQ